MFRRPGPFSMRTKQGVLHRDIKPGNLMLEGDRLWVTDFGLARLQGDAGITMTGDLLGTLRYMSPEQVSGRSLALDERSDVYSLGVTLYELLTLKPAVGGDDRPATLRRIQEETPPPIRKLNPKVPVDLETIVSRSIAKEPEERYATAGELAQELERFLEDRPIHARRPGPFERGLKWIRRRRKLAGAAAAVLLVVLVGLITGVVLLGREQARTSRALAAARESLKKATQQEELAAAAAARARASEHHAYELLYASDLRLAAQVLREGDARLARELLDQHRPQPGRTDLRSFVWHYLDAWLQASGEELAALVGPTYCLARSPDGRLVAVAGREGTIWLLDVTRRGIREQPIEAGQSEINALGFSPDGELLASAGDDGSVCVWRVQSGELARRIEAHDGLVLGVGFVGGGGQRVASAGFNGEGGAVRVWNVENGERLWTRELDAPAMAMAVEPGGKSVAVVWEKLDRYEILDAEAGRLLRRLPTFLKPSSICYSPDGRWVAIGGRYGDLVVEPTANIEGQSFRVRVSDGVESLCFGESGKWLFAGDRAGVIQGVDLEAARAGRGAEPGEVGRWVADDERVYGMCLGGGGRLLSVGSAGRLMSWAIEDMRPLRREWLGGSGLMAQAAGPPGFVAISKSSDGLWLHDVRGREADRLLGAIDPAASARTTWRKVASSRNGEILAGVCVTGVMVWHAATGEKLFQWTSPRPFSYVWDVKLSADGKILALTTGLTRRDSTGERMPIEKWQADIQTFEVELFDLGDGRRITSLKTPTAECLALEAQGRMLAVGTSRRINLYEVSTGARIHALDGHTSSVNSLGFLPDGGRLVSVGADRRMIVWETATGELLESILAHRGPVMSLDLSPDGSLAATLGRDDRLKLWHLPTLQEVISFEADGHWSEVQVRFSSGGRVLTVNEDKTLLVIDTREPSVTVK